MQVYRSERKLYIIQELKNWTIWLTILLFMFLLNYLFSIVSFKSLSYAAILFLFLKAIDAIKEYHVKEIHIDHEADQLIAILKSKMSGDKKLNYKLDPISAELSVYQKKFLLNKPTSLIIYLPDKKYFKITNRYGFATETLSAIHHALNNKSIVDAY